MREHEGTMLRSLCMFAPVGPPVYASTFALSNRLAPAATGTFLEDLSDRRHDRFALEP